MAGTMCISGAVLLKAGAGVSTVLTAGPGIYGKTADAILVDWINEAENEINVIGRFDFVTNWASLTTNTKLMLSKLCSNKAAISAVRYDIDSYPNRIIAEDVINTLLVENQELTKILTTDDSVTYIGK